MKTITKTIAAVLMMLFVYEAEAQLSVNAGNNQTICAGGSVTLGGSPTSVGGTPPYTYAWSPATGISCATCPNPQATPQVTTTYTVFITDAIGDTVSDDVVITVNQFLVIDSTVVTNVSCNGGNDGAVCIYVSGGNLGYTYLWSNGSVTIPCATGGLQAGNYLVTVTDANACTITATATVTEPTQLQLSETHTDVLCNGASTGTINLTVTGGTAPYTYAWTGGVINQNLANVPAGNYAVTVTDAHLCSATLSITIAQPASPLQIDSFTITNLSCFQDTSGSICVHISGGALTYSNLWSNFMSDVPCINSLWSGTYNVMVTDANGCSVSASATVSEPAPLDITITQVTNVSCNGGSDGGINTTPSGGTPNYTYLWSNAVTTQDLIGNAWAVAGSYTVTVTDNNLCSATATATVTEPSAIIANITQIGDGQLPDTLEVSVIGGCAPYNYSWSNNGNWIQNIIDTNGTYTVTVLDNCGCSITVTQIVGSSITVTYPNGGENLVAGQTATLTWTSNNVAQVNIEAYSSISFNWISIANNIANTGSYVLAVPNVPGSQAKIRVTDAANATVTDESDALFNIVAAGLTATFTTTNITCYGSQDGSITITATNGTAPYTYSIDSGTTFQSSNTFLNLPEANYLLVVHDAASGSFSSSFSITEPTQLIAHIIAANGWLLPDTLSASATGGMPGYTYAWSTPPSFPFVIYSYQIYVLTVTDANGCTATDFGLPVCGGLSGCVWPGDADYNGLANNNDLLAIGLGYGTVGTARVGQDINWYPHSSSPWIDTLPTHINYKHIDCDGNGTINSDDTLAIIQNFGLTHAKNNESAPWRAAAPALYVQLAPDTTQAGDTMYANLILGDAIIPATNVYGLAFTLNYDATVVDSTLTRATFGNSWLGTSTDKISIAKDLKTTGELKCAITRIDHTMRSGNGQIGQVSFVITTDNINGKNFAYYNMHVWLSDVTMIDNLGNVLDINEGQDSSQVEFEPTGIAELGMRNAEFKMQPNPASDVVQLSVNEVLVGAEMKIMDIEGRTLTQTTIPTANYQLSTANWRNGIYMVQISSGKSTVTKRLVIAR